MAHPRWLFLSVTLALSACVTAAQGAAPDRERVVLVELFTSQGCSSCPRADALVAELPRLGLGRDKVLPLTFHVDYWDELGWKDPFAAPAFTERQRRYAERGALRSPQGRDSISGLYTPQMIVDGTVHFSGARRDVALPEIQRASTRAPAVAVSGVAVVDVDGDRAVVTVCALPTDKRTDWRVLVALAAKSARTAVTRGENRGETLQEAAIVRTLSEPQPVPPVDQTVKLTLQKPAGLGWAETEIVAFVQSERTLEVGGATAIPISR